LDGVLFTMAGFLVAFRNAMITSLSLFDSSKIEPGQPDGVLYGLGNQREGTGYCGEPLVCLVTSRPNFL
jgi:hypothetical protein